MEKLPVLYCSVCGEKMTPYKWLEGYSGQTKYSVGNGEPYKEYEVWYQCPNRGGFGNEHIDVCHKFFQSIHSNYSLPKSIREYQSV